MSLLLLLKTGVGSSVAGTLQTSTLTQSQLTGTLLLSTSMPAVICAAGNLSAALETTMSAAALVVQVTETTWTITNGATTLTNSNLTAASSSGLTWAGSADFYSTGKYYFEISFDHASVLYTQAGIGDAGRVTSGDNNFLSVTQAGDIYAGPYFQVNIGELFSSDIVCFAIDFDNKKAWVRHGATGNWDNSGTDNPATNTGGIWITSILAAGPLMAPYAIMFSTGDQITLNAGASTFTGVVPAGFMAGWPTIGGISVISSNINRLAMSEGKLSGILGMMANIKTITSVVGRIAPQLGIAASIKAQIKASYSIAAALRVSMGLTTVPAMVQGKLAGILSMMSSLTTVASFTQMTGRIAPKLSIIVAGMARTKTNAGASGSLRILAGIKAVIQTKGIVIPSMAALLQGVLTSSSRMFGKASASLRISSGVTTRVATKARVSSSIGALLYSTAITSARAFGKASATLQIRAGSAAKIVTRGQIAPILRMPLVMATKIVTTAAAATSARVPASIRTFIQTRGQSVATLKMSITTSTPIVVTSRIAASLNIKGAVQASIVSATQALGNANINGIIGTIAQVIPWLANTTTGMQVVRILNLAGIITRQYNANGSVERSKNLSGQLPAEESRPE